jgi:hypothetical protein
VTWRGLHISFHAERQWRQITPIATISAGMANLRAELNPAWTAKGQHWRIEKEITATVGGAEGTAARLRGEITELRQRIADAARRIGEPFPQAGDLETARVRRDAIEQQIHDSALPMQGDAESPGGSVRDAAADDAERIGADLADGAAGYTITPPLILPETTGAGDITSAPQPIRPSEPRARARAVANPVLLARLDDMAEPLFALPDAAMAGPPAGRPGSRTRSRTRTRGALRKASQVAACDNALQPTLFDLPEQPPAEPARKARSGQSRAEAPRQ